jgi:toxin ParE1/3/4
VKVHFTDVASEQLDGIYAHIAADSVHYAQRVLDQITKKAKNIGSMPNAAAIVPEYSRPDIREVFLYHYRIIYRILTDQVDILAVVHGAKPLPARWEDLS